MQSYDTIPYVISKKDLDYLNDIYYWHFNASKLANHFGNEAQDKKIKELLIKIAQVHKEHCKAVLNILE